MTGTLMFWFLMVIAVVMAGRPSTRDEFDRDD
jgi:hypothetical protein